MPYAGARQGRLGEVTASLALPLERGRGASVAAYRRVGGQGEDSAARRAAVLNVLARGLRL